MALPLNPLRNAAGSTRNLSGGIGQLSGPLRTMTTNIRNAASGVGRLPGALNPAGAAIRGIRTRASGVSASAAKLGRSTAPTGVRRFGAAAGRARASIDRIGGGPLGTIMGMIVGMVDIASLLSGLMGRFGIVMTIASIAMTGVNTAMRANPLGFVLGIIIPVAAYLIELALSSETGQRIMKQVFAQVLRNFQRIGAFLGPILKSIGSRVGTAFTAIRSTVTGVLRSLAGTIGTIARIGSAIAGVSNAMRAVASLAFNRLRGAVRPIQKWITDTAPGFFTRAKNAVAGAMRGIGDMLEGGMQTVLSVVKGPISGLIAFANWVIDGLKKLSFSILGKKFGVKLDKIPQLAEGGVVFPGMSDRAPRIQPLSELEQRRVLYGSAAAPKPYRIEHYREEPDAGPRSTAEDLLFLTAAHA
ncbi:tape-measure protein [Streptomyces sp. NPDC004726]